jgi:hypothetical protein
MRGNIDFLPAEQSETLPSGQAAPSPVKDWFPCKDRRRPVLPVDIPITQRHVVTRSSDLDTDWVIRVGNAARVGSKVRAGTWPTAAGAARAALGAAVFSQLSTDVPSNEIDSSLSLASATNAVPVRRLNVTPNASRRKNPQRLNRRKSGRPAHSHFDTSSSARRPKNPRWKVCA